MSPLATTFFKVLVTVNHSTVKRPTGLGIRRAQANQPVFHFSRVALFWQWGAKGSPVADDLRPWLTVANGWPVFANTIRLVIRELHKCRIAEQFMDHSARQQLPTKLS